MDPVKRLSAISIYCCPHDVVFCPRCHKRMKRNRYARRVLKRETKALLTKDP
jgi:hypothetical protein